MFWDKKKGDEGLPDLPERRMPPSRSNYTNVVPDLEPRNEKLHELPSFPDSAMNKGFSQSAIKDAIETEEDDEDELPSLPNMQKTTKLIEMEEWTPKERMAEPKQIGNRPVFVRIDKFREARESLDNIKERLGEIDELLRTIKEVKAKEDQELTSWEREIETIKSKISEVNTRVFEESY